MPTACIDRALAGFDAVECRLDTIDTVLAGETPETLGGKRLAKRLTQSLSRARSAVTAARSGRKVTPNLRKAKKQLHTFTKSVTSAGKKGLAAHTAAELMSLASGATDEIGVLRAAQQ